MIKHNIYRLLFCTNITQSYYIVINNFSNNQKSVLYSNVSSCFVIKSKTIYLQQLFSLDLFLLYLSSSLHKSRQATCQPPLFL